jgi:hypothetical protein
MGPPQADPDLEGQAPARTVSSYQLKNRQLAYIDPADR